MGIDIDKILEIYGNSSIYEINDNMDELKANMKYLYDKGIEDVLNIIELYPYMFLQDRNTFKEKTDNLLNKLGVDYIEKLSEDFNLWSEVDE